MTDESTRAGFCETFSDGIRVQHAACWPCMLNQCPGGIHEWADEDDKQHAALTGQPDPSGQKCGCVCADGPELDPPDLVDAGWGAEDQPLELTPCPVCGEPGACSYDPEGRALLHAIPEDDS